MSWVMLAGSLAAVLALAGAARLLGLGGDALSDEAAAKAIADDLLPGLDAQAARLTDTGAEVTGRDGSVVQLRRHGAHHVIDAVVK